MNQSTQPDRVECEHAVQLIDWISSPTNRSMVYREECTQCFDSQDSPSGIDVCLQCFNGGCASPDHHHAKHHAINQNHSLALNIKRISKPKSQRTNESEPPLKKLAIREENPIDQYEFVSFLKCYAMGCDGHPISTPPSLDAISTAILNSTPSARLNEVAAWEEQIEKCAHVTGLKQQDNPTNPIPQVSSTCHACELSSNLWFCLECGSLGCGRSQFGGTGGNSHALKHYNDTGHCVNVKLGTITAEGSADLYCYNCDDARIDSDLQTHLAHFGIELEKQEKTEKSMTELQVEHNLKFDFSMTGEDGQHLVPVHGPGLTGLKNLGNSCYIASVLQMLFSLSPFQSQYYNNFVSHASTCTAPFPSECLDCQMNKIAHGLLSGRYAIPNNDPITPPLVDVKAEIEPSHPPTPAAAFQKGISPMMFKALVGRGHHEFSTMKQQDAEEFLGYLFETIQGHIKKIETDQNPDVKLTDPTEPFRFQLEQKLQCENCKGVKYKLEDHMTLSLPVPAIPMMSHGEEEKENSGETEVGKKAYQPVTLEQCLESFMACNSVEYTCPKCRIKTTALTSSRIGSFPKYLIVHARRFEVVNWVPKKLEVPLMIEGDKIDLEPYLGQGQEVGEELLPDLEEASSPAVPEVNEETLSVLMSMGFPKWRCLKAIHATGNRNLQVATDWLFERMDDDLHEKDLALAAPKVHPEGNISGLQEMGFTENQARKALRVSKGKMDIAVDWLFNHPEDEGEERLFGPDDVLKEDRPPSVLGDRNLPAQYRLQGFVSHKGPSVHSGHYVAHLRFKKSNEKSNENGVNVKEDWVFFNDEKVMEANEGKLSAKALSP
ncbi:uncharacterized protein MELLADRAFT_37211 [Melampsora larici-populina 98AG31]|uniref:Ubiquitin carboxyl-terminal hydrolase n=1 Tax=Melampsora larici-populina (strain 98AG31 / pathotype 3-4-7) TaxID=747676 RepID=F4RS36_MELLP|nr:uncharacterized protein MELLADRAFT_37211 [Melampsora larici-populina 98AG31]EGG04845.1 hypothetical protein MELLADRAFT_37211 [Melampsora larici-populina 98AG31]